MFQPAGNGTGLLVGQVLEITDVLGIVGKMDKLIAITSHEVKGRTKLERFDIRSSCSCMHGPGSDVRRGVIVADHRAKLI